MLKSIVLACLLLVACKPDPTGGLNERCNRDGTCNGASLECSSYGYCGAKQVSHMDPNRRCFYESECFCVTCADKCGEAGVKECAYSDTSVWGSKPAVCECK